MSSLLFSPHSTLLQEKNFPQLCSLLETLFKHTTKREKKTSTPPNLKANEKHHTSPLLNINAHPNMHPHVYKQILYHY